MVLSNPRFKEFSNRFKLTFFKNPDFNIKEILVNNFVAVFLSNFLIQGPVILINRNKKISSPDSRIRI